MIVFDVDGVVLDLESRVLDVVEELEGRRPQRLNGNYRFGPRFGLSDEAVARLWRRFEARGLWGDLNPYPGAAEVLRAVQALGLPIAFVTGIDPADRALRAANLERLGIRDFGLYCTGSAFAPKGPMLTRLGARAFVDDRLRHLSDAAAIVEHLAWIDQGEDQDIAHDEVPGANRHASLAEWLEAHHDWLEAVARRVGSARPACRSRGG
ncbi:MAG TPA: HAD family hydrolase [Rhodocyclaceae bacterium]|nr:HAD family hydrolase [Rhodocyclaceae bacterium]